MIESPPRGPEAVPLLNATDFPGFIQAWQLTAGQDAQIVTVKASFRLTPDGAATPLPEDEQAMPEGEVPFEESDAARYPGDMAFFKPRADVAVLGHAYSTGRDRTVRRVELRLGRDYRFELIVIGDRTWTSMGPSAPARFDKIELRPEFAFGGPESPDNPVGRGFRAPNGAPLPNLERPSQLLRSPRDRVAPVFTTPIASSWPARAQKTGNYGGDWLQKRAPYFPGDFDWSHFNAAPAELQIDYPRGDESYLLDGVRPDGERLSGSLPGIQMRAFAQPSSDKRMLFEIPMRLDTLVFEPEELALRLVWRGAIASADAYGSDLASIFVCSDPVFAPRSEAAIRAHYDETLKLRFDPEPEVIEPDEVTDEDADDEAPSPALVAQRGASRARGVTPSMARLLGLPGWMVSLPDPEDAPPEPMPPPPPAATPAMTKAELDALIAGDASLAELDLSHCDFTDADLRGRDLRGALLLGANLEGARFDTADLSGASLAETSGTNVCFAGANLSSADLDSAAFENVDFTEANLEHAMLTKLRAPQAKFERATLTSCIAAEAFLFGANFDGADLSDGDFSAAVLEDATFRAAKLNDTAMYEAKAMRAIFDDAEMNTFRGDGTNFSGASMKRVKADESCFRGADLSDADMTRAELESSIFAGTRLERANLSQVEAKEARFKLALLRDARFVKANLMRSDFEGADLSSADLRGANFFEASVFNAKTSGAKWDHAIRSS